jgi:heat shock protein HslJ
VSVSVTENGEPRPLVAGTRIELTFEARDEDGSLALRAGCNILGAGLRITPSRLVVDAVGGTEMGCADELHRQDRWVASFFGSDPAWRLDGDRLTLTSDATVIELDAADA